MMALSEAVSKLNTTELPERQVYYVNITKLLSENNENLCEDITSDSLQNLCSVILNDLENEAAECPQLIKLFQCLLQNKNLQRVFAEEKKEEVMKSIISYIDSNQHENTLVNCFSVIQISPSLNLENDVLKNLLERMEEILSKRIEAISAYFIICNYFQKFLKDYEGRLSNFIPVLSKLVFLPLCHPSSKIREVAEKTLDMFPKLLLYTADEDASNSLLKLVKESYSRDLLLLFKDKQELYVLKVWKHVVSALANVLPANLPVITPFFQVIEKGFKSSSDDVCIASFVVWKTLINCFAITEGILNDSKKLRFILKPFKNIARLNENILSVACDSWWYLAWNLSEHLSARFTEVCIPLLELAVGKFSNGHSEKAIPKGGSISLIKKCCYMLLRFLEQPPSESFSRLSSPKKLPHIPYPSLQIPIDLKVIARHFREILYAFKVIIDVYGTKEDMKHYLDSLMKSVLFIVSSLIEDTNKDSVEAVTSYLYFLNDVIESKFYPSVLCLKSLESLSKLPRKILVSHCFNCGSRKSQDILCITLLKLLLNSHLFPSEAVKRFFATYNRLIQAGLNESFDTLLVTQKFMHVVRSAIGSNTYEVELLIEIWSGIATPLLEIIEKTQEVNQGDKQEHDFSCMYDVLMFPFEFIFPVHNQQFRTRPAFKLWTSLYKAFVRSSSLVTTTATNEACESFCSKLKACLKEDQLRTPHFFESVCLFLQVVIESIDFSTGTTSGIPVDVTLMTKRKKPLGNFTSFVELLNIMLKTYDTHYIESEDDSDSPGVPTIQRKLHIIKNGVPLDLLKTFFASVKSGSIISCSLEQLSDPLSKLYLKSSQKKNLLNHIDNKLENLWNVLTSSVERYYLGPYDSEFLAILSPILEATFSHPKRNFKEKSRRFWCATFGLNMSSLKFPESLKNVLKKMKLPLLPDDISPTEFSISPPQTSVSEVSIDVNPPVFLNAPTTKLLPAKSSPCINGEISKPVVKETKPPPKVSIEDLPSEEFVKIDTPPVAPSISRRRSIRKRKSFVPTLYNDLSQDLSNAQSSQESQDTASSASLEEPDFKQPMIESKEISVKKVESKETLVKKFETREVPGKKVETKEDCVNVESKEVSVKKVETKKVSAKKVESKEIPVKKVETKAVSIKEVESKEIHIREVKNKSYLKETPNNAESPALDLEKNEQIVKTDEKEINYSSNTCSENEEMTSTVSKLPMVVKLIENQNNGVKKEVNNSKETILIDLAESDEVIESSETKKHKEISDRQEKCKKNCNINEKMSVFSKAGGKQPVFQSTRKNKRLSQSFSIPSTKRCKILFEKINKSCTEIALSDSEEMIPSSQGTPDNEGSVKLSLNNYKQSKICEEQSVVKEQKSLNDDADTNDFEVFSACLSPDRNNEVLNDKFITNDRKTFLTSTPSKLKVPILLDPENSDSEELVDTKNNNDLDENASKSCNMIDDRKSSDTFENTKSSDAGNDIIMKSTFDDDMKTGFSLDEEIKDLDFLLDAVEDIVNAQPLINNEDQYNDKICPKSPDGNTENMLLSESENVTTVILAPESETSELKEVKKSRVRKSIIDFSQKETYSLKLRNKTYNVTKPLSRLRQRKSMSKGVDNYNKQTKRLSENSRKSTILPRETLNNSSSDVNRIISSTPGNVTQCKSSDLNIGLHLEDANEDNPCIPEDNLLTQKAPEFEELGDKPNQSSPMVNDVNMDELENAESCEIFDTVSEDSCKIVHVDDDNSHVTDNIAVGNVLEPNIESTSQSKDDSLETNEASVNRAFQPMDDMDSKISSSNENKEKLDNMNTVLIIPSSFKNDVNLDMLQKSDSPTMMETDSNYVSNDYNNPLNSLSGLSVPLPSKDNVCKTESTFCVQFDDTEDDSNQQIRVIVDSVIQACGDSSISDDSNNLSDKVVLENKNLSNTALSEVALKEKKEIAINCSNKKTFTRHHQKQHDECDVKISAEEILNQSPQSVSSSDYSDSVATFSCDSVHVMKSNDIQGEFPLESSNKIDCNKLRNSQNNTDESNIKEIAESDNLDFTEKIPVAVNHKSPLYSNSNKAIDTAAKVKVSQECINEPINILCDEVFPQSEEIPNGQRPGVFNNELDISKEKARVHSSYEVKISEISVEPFVLNSIFDTQSTSESVEKYEDVQDIVRCLIEDVILFITKSEESGFTKSSIAKKELSSTDTSINIPYTLKIGDSARKAIQSNSDISGTSAPSNAANKENRLDVVLSDNKFAKGSKKRKIKAPIRSPINFRQRGKIDSSKKPLIKGKKTVNITFKDSQNKSLITESVISTSTVEPQTSKSTDSSMTQIISSLVESIATDDTTDSDVLDVQSCSSNSESRLSKAHKIELSTDELTDLNTRLNASIAPQTRRSKLIAASQKTSADEEKDASQTDIVIVCSEDSTSNLPSILKKRKSTSSCPPSKMRKVTFASPLIQELVIESYSETKGLETLTLSSIQKISKKIKKVLQEKNKPDKINPAQTPTPSVSEDIPSSSEYQDSDVLDFCELPVSPALINCQDSISNILNDLTSPSWVRGLESLLISKNIKTIGDVCKLNIHQLKALPFKSPKVLTLHKALTAYLTQTQESVLEKFKTIDDGSFSMDTSVESSSSAETPKIATGKSNEYDDSKLLVETVNELLKDNRLKELPLHLLGELIKACGNAITENSEQPCIVID